MKRSVAQVFYFKRAGNFLDEISKETTDLAKIDKFLKGGVDINDSSSGNVLQIACGMRQKTERLALVKKLVEKGSEVNCVSSSQQTPLHICCRNPNMELEVIQHLVKSGTDINALDIDGRTCLFWAVENLSVEVVEYLCQEGCDWHVTDEYGETATFWAAKLQKVLTIKYLLTQKVDVSSSPGSSKDLFDQVERRNRSDVVSFFCGVYGRTKFLTDLSSAKQEFREEHREYKEDSREANRDRQQAVDTNTAKIQLEEELILKERKLDENDQKEERKMINLRYTRERVLEFVCQRKRLQSEVSLIQTRRHYYEDIGVIDIQRTANEREEMFKYMFPVPKLPKFSEAPKLDESLKSIQPKGESKIVEQDGKKVVMKAFNPDYLNGDFLRDYVQTFLSLRNRHVQTPSGGIVDFMSGEVILTKPFEESTLSDYISESRESTVLTDLNFILSVAKGLDFLYSHGKYHGNLKINNIFLDENKMAVLSDYYMPEGDLVGITKKIPSQLSNSVSEFLAPELYFLNKPMYHSIQKLDIYAFGLMCYCIITKKSEGDLYHRLGKGTGPALVKFVHENSIRPLLKEFPVELGIEFREEYGRVIDRAFEELGIEKITSKKQIKEFDRNVERVVKKSMNYQTPPKRMKKIVGQFVLEGKKIFKKKMIGKKVKAKQEAVDHFKKNVWEVEWYDYYDKNIAPRILEEYTRTVQKWDLITNEDLNAFKSLLTGELIPLLDQKMVSYFEMFWNDMVYVKNHIQKFPASFIELMTKCWEADPNKRPRDFSAIREHIKNIIMKQITNVKTFSAEQFKNQMKRYEQDREDIVQTYEKLRGEEVDHYSRFDEYLLRMRAMEDEKNSRETVLKKINDEIEKLNNYSVLLQMEMGKVTMSYTMLMKEKKNYLDERVKLSKQRIGLNEREKEVKIKIQDMKEKQEMAKMVI